ncbi:MULTISPECIES: SpaA isopeptide-forming pilin-related protein [Anaerococcus]|uniref:SpaA isopeptide-forming pilin-related protein n=1 Tax=Anaerococcus TaxID=165779 RepID=UPI00242B49F8|nr:MULTISPECIES: SpaA isopeptide-forming pilin-related protein [Anaerococcus]MDD7766035.1 SpaA isopeptide-forming pilin-related protein [Anaerococcus vaginalis]MDY6127099.1 SpaA isopeptide-forming pilin-related protein [Anaerococcus sp.]
MKRLLRKLTSFAIALFMVLQVMLPAFATRSKAEELEPNTIKNIENLETNEDAYLSITNSQKIYDKKKIDKDESKFSIAVGLPSTSSSFRLVKRNDLKLYEDKIFQTNEDASKEYWRIKDMLNLQGLDLDLEIIKEDQGYKILTKNEMENLEQGKKDNFYGENYSYIDFKILDDFDFDEKGNQKLLNQDKLVFNLEFIKNISPDPNYNLFEQDEQGNWNIKNEGDIFALINEDKKNLYDTNSLTNDLNSLNAYKEERKQAEEEKAQKEAEKKAEEERKAEEEKKQAEQKAKEEEEKKAEEKKAQEEKQKEENANFEKANKELKEALEDENNSIEDIQKLLTELGEKYNLSLASQEKLMAENDSAIKALVEKDRNDNFRANMLRQLPRKVPSNSWDGKLFHLNLEMNVKASPANPIPQGWYFDVQLGPYLKDDIGQAWNDLYDGNRLIASPVYDKAKHTIRYVFQTIVTKDTKLTVDQYLGFDLKNIGEQRDIDIDIKVAPKNNPIQSMTTKHVAINDENPVESSYNVVSQGQSEAKHYPFQLNWTSEQQYYGGTNPTVEWNIEVDTASLKANDLDFNNLNVSIFAGAEQGLNNFKFKASTNKFDLDDTRNYISSSRLGEILQKNTSIAKNELGEKLYIRVKAEVNKTRLHDYYSIGLRINPDGNYIKKMLDEFIEEYNKLPAIIKWMKGAEQAKEFSKLPFNLIETMIPAKSTERDNFTSENLYYDSSRTIYAKRDSDKNVDWYALDLLRLGEKPDQAFNNPEFLINNTPSKSITPKVFYYVPQENGLYKRTPNIGEVVTEYGDFYPGTLISYEYDNQIGIRDDTYRFEANIKEKKVNNLVGETTTGGRINLFTKKVSNKDLTDKYLAYLENPYPIMRINKNFDMVQCFNKGTPDPAFKGSDGIFLDIHEDPSGDYLISRLNENVGNPNQKYRLVNHLNGTPTDDGIVLNPNGMSQGQAMEDLMKRIYFYGEQVKKEYTQGRFNDLLGSETNGEVMHRLIENSMYQRVLHHFTDGVSISGDFFETSSNYNEDSWKVNYTLTGSKNPDGSWTGDYFDGEKKSHNTIEGLRKLKDNETTIKNYPVVKNTQYEMANELLKKVIASYKKGSDWNKDKANTVQLVFYSHTKEGWYQELITGRITEPLEIDKYTNDGKTKLEGAKFTFINKYTNEKVEWTSKKDNNEKLYLKPGYYIVQEEAPSGYEPIKEFEIQVKRSLVNEDKGPYKFKNLPEIHVNDGYKTEVKINEKDIPKSADDKNLVEIDKDNKVKVKLTNIQDNLGEFEFVKKNEFAKLNGAEFTLRKVTAASLDDLKAQIKDPTKIKYDDTYKQTSKGYYGEFKFEQIPKGYYVLEETKVPAGYQKAPLYILEAKEEIVAGKNKVVLHFVGDNSPKEKDGDLTILRNYPKETEIEFRKIREILEGEEKQGLADARFRLESLWTKDGSTYLKDLTSDSIKKEGGKENEKGYFLFDKLKVGDYKLTEIQAPYGYQVLDSYWRIEVREGENGELVKTVYEVKKDGTEEKIDPNKEPVYELTNKPRTIDVKFTKYLGELEKDEEGKIKLDKDGKPIVNKKPYTGDIPGKGGKPVSFDLYSSDYYGAIIGEKVDGKIKPIQTGITRSEDGFFHLKGLEFGKYYVLRETNPPEGYNVANDILLKVEAEAIASVGEMKVIVRDPNTNADTGDHSIFKGVIDFREGEQLGKFSIRKTGNAISYVDKDGKLVIINKDNPKIVGLRRAYFRLYTANKEFEIEKNPGGYAKEYIQKVTPGNPIILYLTEEKAKTMSQEDLNKLEVVGYKNFKSKDGKEVSYAVDKDGKRFRIGEDPSTLPANQGIVTFDNLKPGYYVLQEFRGPAGYEKTTDEWYVYVDNKGRTYRSDKKFDPETLDQGIQSISSITNPSMSPRLQMAGLDVSDQLPINRLLAPSLEEDLQDIEYDSSTDDLNIKVKASKVDTTNGKRTINFSISPKEKEVSGKKIQMVFLVERSKDSATTAVGQRIANGRTLDKNINYAITQIAKKAEETGTQVDVSFIEYNATKTALKTTNTSLNNISKSLQDVNYENMYFDVEGEKANQTYKDFLANANISPRNNSNNDGSQKLLDSIDSYLTSISKDGYDKKIMIDFANFHVENVKRYGAVGGNFKFKKADLVNKFKDGGFETFVAHTDQKSVILASGYQSQYAYTVMPQLKYFEYFKNSGSPGRNSASYYVYKNMVNEILNNDGFVNNGDGLLVKDGKLDIGLRPLINLLSTSAKIGTNDISNNIVKDSTNNTISLGGINLKKGESLDFSYTIDLKEGTEFGKNYPINKSDIDKGVKFTNNGKENLISSTYPKSNGELYTKKIKETPTPNTYKVTINPIKNGSVSARPTSAREGETITLSATPDKGYKFVKYVVTANGQPVTVTGNTFKMPASDVTVSATFVEDSTTPQGYKNLEVNFTYSGSVNGNAQAPGADSPGRLELFEEGKIEALETIKAVNEGKLQFSTKLDPSKNYRLVYTREDKFAKDWALPNVSNYTIDSESITKAKDTVSLTIANGNTLDIFNKDETGFRIPLRITKVNENNGVLTGAQFSARKILKGEEIVVDGEKKYPQYYEEAYDGVSEATGLPGDNYFRELSPGLYELTETKAPNGSYRLPKDENGKDKKWYFKVVIAKDENGNYKNPADDDYMKIEFQFTEKLPAIKNDPRWALNEVDDDLVGKEIHGIKLGDGQYDKFTEIIRDDHRSDPARPDAPYKGIDDVKVTNFLKTTEISFHKKDLATYQNIEKAEFTLKRAKLDKDGNLTFDNEGNPQYENLDEKEKGDDGKEYDKFIKPEGYDKTINGVKKESKKAAEVIFSNLEQGTYILKESKPADGYKLNENFLAITLKADEKGYWKQEIVAYQKDGNGYKKVENPESIFRKDHDGDLDIVFNNKDYIDFKFQKIEGVKDEKGNDILVESSDFRVTQVDEDGKPIPGGYDKPLYSYVNSKFTFTGLGVGRYKLQETRVLEKFIKPDPWYFRVVQDPKTYKLKIVFEDHDASIRFTPENETDDGKNTPQLDDKGNPKDIKVANYKKTRFVFKKQDQDGNILPDVYFNLKKLRQTFDSKAYDYTNDAVSSATYTYNKSARSQKSGAVTFDTLGEGIYELRETDKPEGYDSKAVQDRWIIQVVKTENGLQAIYDKAFEKKYYEKYENYVKDEDHEQDGYYKEYIKNGFDKKSNLEQKQVGEFNYILTNTKTTVDLKWKKVTVNKDIIKDKQTKFIMLKNSDDPTKLDAAKDGNSSVAPYQLIETDGVFEVKNLSKGIYTLIETKAPDGFKEMDRQIVIQIYEDEKDNYKLKKKFYEMKKDADSGENVLVDKTQEFSYIFTRKNNTEVDTDGFGYFYVKNDEKQQYFYLTKGFLTDSNGRKVFNNITKGELHLKLTNTEDDKDVFRTTIDLAKDSNAGIYKFDVNGIKIGKTYLLEEEKAPNGYKLSTNKYKLLFVADTTNPGKVIAILKAVLDKNNKELKNARGQLVTEDGKVIGDGITINIADPNSILKVINEKNKVEFTKVGKDEVKGEGGKLVTKEDPLQNVEFILEKQDPKDWDKENKGYYPVTKDIEFIKKDDEGLYIEKSDGTKQRKVGVSNVTIDNSAYKGKSDAKGKFTFEGLTDGFYQVMEPKAPTGFMQVNGPVKKFRVLEGKIYIYDKVDDDFIEKEVTDDNIGTLGKIVNEKPGKGEFKIKKVDENNRPLANVKYTLHKTDENETQVGEERTTDENGEISFKDLPYGYYWLKERKTINGYILDTKKKLITLGGGDWGETPARKDDVSKYITFDGAQKELISTADIPSKTTVYPNKAEGMIANFKFKIDPNKEIRPGDYFTIDFSDNIDLDGIFKDNDNKGKNPDSQFDIIGPAGKLAEAKINPDRTSITYTFTKYVGDYRPDFMSMFMQIFPNRRVVDHIQDITVDVNIGNNTDKTNKDYHYSDSININYRGWNDKNRYDGYQDPNVDISSYMLRLDPDNQTFTAIVYYNPWNKNLGNKNISFTADKDIVQNSLSVKTYRKSGWGSHSQGWQDGDLPDSYDVDFNAKNLTHISDFYRYEPRGNTGNTRKIYIPNDNLTQNGYNTNTYVIEIKGKLAGNSAKSLKATVEYKNHYVNYSNGAYWYSHTGSFQTWSKFFNPRAIGDAIKELKLLNFKNKIEFVKIDGGVLSNVVDQSSENPESLKDLGIGRVLKGATFKLQKQNGSSWDEVENSTRISDDNGVFSWEGLSEGKYRVIETVTPDDEHYDLPTKEVSSFEVDDKGNIVEIKNNKQIIENYKKAEIRVRKTDENGQSIEGAEFLLEKDNDDKYTANIGTEKDGTILFNNLPAGKYTLTERKAPKGYTKSDAVWKLEVTRDGKVKWLNSFDDTKDKMKTVENLTYKQNGDKPENLDTEIIGIDKENKTFRQKITIKAKPSDIKKTKLILESTDPSLKLSQANTKVRLVSGDEANQIGTKDNTSYKVKINGGDSPNLTLTITPPYKEEDKNKPVGSEQGQTPQEEKEKYYQFIVDMPYKDEGRVGAKATYQIGTINKISGKVEFGENDAKQVLDKYLENATQITAGDNKVNMTQYDGKYLDRDVNLITLDIANIKNPDIYFKKVDADKPDKALAGAEFEIRRKNDNGNFVPLTKDGTEFLPKINKEEDKWKVTSGAQGQFEFEKIPNGEYQIFETKAPEGYALVDKIVFKFDVENGKIIYKDKKDNKISKIDLNIQDKNKENSDTNRILVTNKKAQYPSTGGPGVWIGYTILGLIIMFVAVLAYSKRKDKLIV